MTSEEATARVIQTLEDMSINYMLVGAISSNVYGIPRSTKDADVVVAFDSVGVVEFARRLVDYFLGLAVQLRWLPSKSRNQML